MTNEKNVKYYDNLAVASSPHLVTALDTQKTMMWVLIALIPSFIASVFYFGAGAVILTFLFWRRRSYPHSCLRSMQHVL